MGVKHVNLWERVNANSFEKVNAFGPTVQFYFSTEGDSGPMFYYSPVGKVFSWGSSHVVLQIQVKMEN